MEMNAQLHVPAALSEGKILPESIEFEARWVPEKYLEPKDARNVFCLAGNRTVVPRSPGP